MSNAVEHRIQYHKKYLEEMRREGVDLNDLNTPLELIRDTTQGILGRLLSVANPQLPSLRVVEVMSMVRSGSTIFQAMLASALNQSNPPVNSIWQPAKSYSRTGTVWGTGLEDNGTIVAKDTSGPYPTDHVNMADVWLQAGVQPDKLTVVNVVRTPVAPVTSTRKILENEDGMPLSQYGTQWTDLAVNWSRKLEEKGVEVLTFPYDLPGIIEGGAKAFFDAWNKRYPHVPLSPKLDMDTLNDPEICDWGQAALDKDPVYYGMFVGPTIGRKAFEYSPPSKALLRGVPQHEEIRRSLGPTYRELLMKVADRLSLQVVPEYLDLVT